MINVYAKIDGKLAHWEVECETVEAAIKAVKTALTADFVGAVLASVKWL